MYEVLIPPENSSDSNFQNKLTILECKKGVFSSYLIPILDIQELLIKLQNYITLFCKLNQVPKFYVFVTSTVGEFWKVVQAQCSSLGR